MQPDPQQFVMAMAPTVLRDRAPAGLAGWYATPLAAHAASDLLELAQADILHRLRDGGDYHQLHVLVLLCRFWLDRDGQAEYRELAEHCADGHARALLELVYGQLLASCKLAGAARHLAQGFRQAAGLLCNSDYFHVMHRHELLDYLPLAECPAPALDLPELLAEAAVIRRLQDRAVRRVPGSRLDTLG